MKARYQRIYNRYMYVNTYPTSLLNENLTKASMNFEIRAILGSKVQS